MGRDDDVPEPEEDVDRDSEGLAAPFDERDKAVKRAVTELIERAIAAETPVGIRRRASSDYPDFAAFLVRQGIDSLSLSPDSGFEILRRVAEVENEP